MRVNLPHMRSAAVSIASAVLAAGLFVGSAGAQAPSPGPAELDADDMKEFQGKMRPGSTEYTDSKQAKADKAYRNANDTSKTRTAEEQKKADDDFVYAYGMYHYAVVSEAVAQSDYRAASEQVATARSVLDRTKSDPNASASDIAKAEFDLNQAVKTRDRTQRKREEKIEGRYPKRDVSRFYPEKEGEKKTQNAQQSEKNEKQSSSDISGPFDFMGNVSIGVGVGVHGDDDRGKGRGGSCGHRGGKKAKSKPKGEGGKSPRGCGCGRGAVSGGDDRDDD